MASRNTSYRRTDTMLVNIYMKTYKLSVVEVYIVGIGVFDINQLAASLDMHPDTGCFYSISDRILDWLSDCWLKAGSRRYYHSTVPVLVFLQRLARRTGSKYATYPDNGVIDLLIDGSLVGWLRVV